MSKGTIPTWVKLAYTGFMCVLVPKYWMDYGPTNFLYFCDVALFFALGAVWLESPLLASAPAVGILIPQSLWMADFLSSLLGKPLVAMTAYMFDEGIPLFTRGLSFFHFWLPIFLVYLVAKLGYDRRALPVWTVLAIGLLLICYFILPPPPAPTDNPNLPVNVNYVFGFSESAAQTWMAPELWLMLLIVGMPILVFYPTHWILNRLFGTRRVPTNSTPQE